MLVVVEPGQRSIDCALRVLRMGHQIGLKDLRIVANKITCPEDEAFIRAALPDHPILGAIPFNEAIRRSDMQGMSVLDALPEADLEPYVQVLGALEKKT